MGCATSKLDDSPAVALCRHRCASLDEAVRHRFAFAEAHAAYLHSLNAVGLSLHRFFNQDLHLLPAASSSPRPSSPLLNLPPARKGDPKIQHHLHSRSDSGSHLQFDSDSDEEAEPLHHRDVNFSLTDGGGFMNMNYMRNQTTPSVARTHLPMSAETMHIGESIASSSPYYANDSNRNFEGYSNYGGGGGFFGDSSSAAAAAPSTSKEAPPPPSPPRSSTWDFLNPFETVEKFYPAYTSSHDSREVREEEGIPDLEEDDDDDDEVVKGVHGDHKLVEPPQENSVDSKEIVKKSAVIAEESSKNGGHGDEFKRRGGFKDDLDVLKEIQVQFEKASQCGNDLSKFLEVGKLPYKQKQGKNISIFVFE